MQRLTRKLAIPTVLSFIALMLFGKKIQEFSMPLFLMTFGIFLLGFVLMTIQIRRDHDRRVADRAIAEYKQERGLAD